MTQGPARGGDVPELVPLLEALAAEPEQGRHQHLLATCGSLGQAGSGPLLRSMLSSPEKWQRDLAAGVANEMGFDPFVEEDVAVEAQVSPEPVLVLGFDESDPPAPERGSHAGVPRVRLDAPEEDSAEAVTFLGACVEPRESGGEPSLGPALLPAPRPLVWLVVGLVALAGMLLLRQAFR
jgi:hypothetical protein